MPLNDKQQAQFNIVCQRIAEGESLRGICVGNSSLPNVKTIMRWIGGEGGEDARQQYAQARDAQADFHADAIIEIADDATNDWMERHGKDDAGWQANGEHIQRSKLRVDARKWIASKLKPRKYGDKLALGGDKENPLVHQVIEWRQVKAEDA